MFYRGEIDSYNDLVNELTTKAAVLKSLINDRWNQYLPDYDNPMLDMDSWLNLVESRCIELTNTEDAKARLIATPTMIKKGKEYEKNHAPWLRNMAPLAMNNIHNINVDISSALIIEHASRRVDFFFLSLLFFYNKSATIQLGQTQGNGRKLQNVHGTADYNTEACHSAIASNFIARSPNGANILIPNHLAQILNTTVELPKSVNNFDHNLEGNIKETLQSVWRKASIKILNQTSQVGHDYEPRKALLKFLLQLVHFFSAENITANYWSTHCSSENRLIFALQCIGSFYFLWSSEISLEDYIHSQMRLKLDEITPFKEQKFFRINKYKALSSELAGIEAVSWITEFFSMDLTNESKREELRNDDFVIDVLDNLVCFEETFESAMDILAALSDFDYDFEESSHCPIQYRVNLNFSPLLGGISYEQRLTYYPGI